MKPMDAVAKANAIARSREAGYTSPDYKALNAMVKRQRKRLTRAQAIEDPHQRRDEIIRACIDAVREWEPASMWPDDWANWQRALDDALPLDLQVDLSDLTIGAALLDAEKGSRP